MSDYKRNKEYKELVSNSELLEEEILNFLKSLSGGEEMVKKFVLFGEIQEKKIDIKDEELSHLEWYKDNETDEKDDEIKDLERKIEKMQDQLEGIGVGVNANSLDDVMKLELWEVAKNKFTLTQLEEKFGGSKWQIM